MTLSPRAPHLFTPARMNRQAASQALQAQSPMTNSRTKTASKAVLGLAVESFRLLSAFTLVSKSPAQEKHLCALMEERL